MANPASLSSVKLENYDPLIRQGALEVKAIGLLDTQGRWGGGSSSDQQSMQPLLDQDWEQLVTGEDEPVTHLALDGQGDFRLIDLHDMQAEVIGYLAVLSEPVDAPVNPAMLKVTEQQLQTVAKLIENELVLQVELNSMSDELVERYEELNLVYDYDPFKAAEGNGEETLKYLVSNCTNYLSVAMTALILPMQNISIYDYAKSDNRPDPAIVLPSLKEDIYQWVKQNKQPMVINGLTEPLRSNCCPSLVYKLIALPVFGGEGSMIGVLAILRQISDIDFTNSDRNLLDVMSKKITKVVNQCYDPMTGLSNLKSFESILKGSIEQARLKGISHAIILVDVDKLQVINDLSGRLAGDRVIQEIGELLRRLIRHRDQVARMGGDRFGILLDDCPLSIAEDLAQRIRSQIQEMDFSWGKEEHAISVSIGIAPVTPKSENITDVLGAVEAAHSVAKSRGRNQMKIFVQDDINLLHRRDEVRWASRIQQAIKDDRFEIYAQQIQPLQNQSEMPHLEILLRMLDEDGEIVPPIKFIPAAEHYALMPEIDRWVVRHTLEKLAGHRCHVAINLSGQSLCNEGFLEFLLAEINKGRVPAHHLSFEVTESAAIANLEEADQLIGAIKKLGCKFSLDDFGTGLSSFAYLKNLNVDYLKIDGSFVREIENDEISEVMVKAIHEVGKAMGLDTIAEFVEDDQIKDHLVRMGIDYGQGFGLAKPRPLEELMDELEKC